MRLGDILYELELEMSDLLPVAVAQWMLHWHISYAISYTISYLYHILYEIVYLGNML